MLTRFVLSESMYTHQKEERKHGHTTILFPPFLLPVRTLGMCTYMPGMFFIPGAKIQTTASHVGFNTLSAELWDQSKRRLLKQKHRIRKILQLNIKLRNFKVKK